MQLWDSVPGVLAVFLSLLLEESPPSRASLSPLQITEEIPSPVAGHYRDE